MRHVFMNASPFFKGVLSGIVTSASRTAALAHSGWTVLVGVAVGTGSVRGWVDTGASVGSMGAEAVLVGAGPVSPDGLQADTISMMVAIIT